MPATDTAPSPGDPQRPRSHLEHGGSCRHHGLNHEERHRQRTPAVPWGWPGPKPGRALQQLLQGAALALY